MKKGKGREDGKDRERNRRKRKKGKKWTLVVWTLFIISWIHGYCAFTMINTTFVVNVTWRLIERSSDGHISNHVVKKMCPCPWPWTWFSVYSSIHTLRVCLFVIYCNYNVIIIGQQTEQRAESISLWYPIVPFRTTPLVPVFLADITDSPGCKTDGLLKRRNEPDEMTRLRSI